MAIRIIEAGSAQDAFEVLEELMTQHRDLVFRGHSSIEWRLQSTLHRFAQGHIELSIADMDEMLNHFFARLAAVGKLPSHPMDRRTRLEYGRHYGLPSPLIDFTHSPYIALWFAFNGVQQGQKEHAAVYALDVLGLGILWQKYVGPSIAFDQFRWSERAKLFENEYPIDQLQFVQFPASWNTRMLRQMGVFVYDSLRYGRYVNFDDLEDFIEKGIDPRDPMDNETFTLHKVVVPVTALTSVFERLELMGITGTMLYDNHEGAVADVRNSHFYNRKTGYAHDINAPE